MSSGNQVFPSADAPDQAAETSVQAWMRGGGLTVLFMLTKSLSSFVSRDSTSLKLAEREEESEEEESEGNTHRWPSDAVQSSCTQHPAVRVSLSPIFSMLQKSEASSPTKLIFEAEAQAARRASEVVRIRA